MKGYPAGFMRLLLAALGLVLLSGLLLAPTSLQMRADVSLGWQLPAAGRVGVAALHAGAGMLLMGLSGALWSVHMRAGWRRRRQRRSGGLLAGGLGLLALSALAVYYVGDEALASVVAFAHLGVGLALALVFGWHWRAARRAHLSAG
jgi:hypothetical protein